jgi:hypothetical protein
MDKQAENQHMRRERATYRYLAALDAGDMNTIIDVCQQAAYDAQLEHMILEAHQAYFQEEQEQKDALAHLETRLDAPPLVPVPIPSKPRGTRESSRKHVSPSWMYTLVAVLVVGVLIGSFVTFLTLRRAGTHDAGIPATPTPSCRSYPLKEFDVPGPAPDTALTSVAAVSENNAWAVGYSSVPTATSMTESGLIEHWNGKNWQVVPSPTTPLGNSTLSKVAAFSANDVWAVGYSWKAWPTQSGPVASVSKTLIEHWNGKSWQVIASPNAPAGNGVLNALTIVAQNDIWVVGSSYDNTSQTPYPLLEHWNGTSWSIRSLQNNGSSIIGGFDDVAASSSNDVWAVGIGRSPGETTVHGLAERWNGQQWQAEAVSPLLKTLHSVSVLSARNAWAIGNDSTGAQVVAQWDGQQWKNMPLPSSLVGKTGYLSQIVAVTPTNIWVVGTSSDDHQASNALLAHWNGKSWRQIPFSLQASLNLPINVAEGLAVYGGHQLWIVGNERDIDGGNISAFSAGQLTCP